MVHRSPTTDKVRASEHVILSICCQRIRHNSFAQPLRMKLDSKMELGKKVHSKMEPIGANKFSLIARRWRPIYANRHDD